MTDPVSESDRIELFDILRGFALFGILLVNFRGLIGQRMPDLDRIVVTGLEVLVLNSFYPLFSFLFGLGFALQFQRMRRGVGELYVRRMCALFLIGTAHAVFVWSGDILVDYAVFGLVLSGLHRVASRAVPLVIVLLFGFQIEQMRIRAIGAADDEILTAEARSDKLQQGQLMEQRIVRSNALTRTGRHFAGDVVRQWMEYTSRVANFADWRRFLTRDLLLLFFVGFYVGGRRWLQEPLVYRSRLMTTALTGLGVAACSVAYRLIGRTEISQVATLSWLGANYGMTVFYVAGIASIVGARGRLAGKFSTFAVVGRMALTNYLLQSVVMTWLFLPYGLGRAQPGAAVGVLLHVTLFFFVQIPLSRWWLKRFEFGPIEWLWRSATYASVQPLRHSSLKPQLVGLP